MTQIPLAQNPTALALMHALPILPVPSSGPSPAIDAMKKKASSNCFLIGWNGIFAWTSRPWVRALIPLSEELPLHGIYGEVDAREQSPIVLNCTMIPGELLDEIADHFRKNLPNEAGAFILWNKPTGTFRIVYPRVTNATPSRLQYETVHPEADEYVVADIHSHGYSQPYWSMTDNRDDAHQTILSVVIGSLGPNQNPTYKIRFCSRGIYFVLNTSAFTETKTVSFEAHTFGNTVSFYVPETP